jgi:MarR family 2-MHQ and catechol resistance regulon transcriptional repressor
MNDLKTIISLFRATDAFSKAIQKDVKAYGLNVTEFGIMEALYHKKRMSIKALLEKVLITNSTMSYVIEQLIKKDYIQKQQSEEDRRSYVLELSENGYQLMDSAFKLHKKHMRSIIDVLSKEEEQQLRDMLKRIGKRANEYAI